MEVNNFTLQSRLILRVSIFCFLCTSTFVSEAQVAKRISSILKTLNVQGATVIVTNEKEVLFQQYYGYRDRYLSKSVNKNTLFPIGSCSKAFTAALTGIHKVDLDKPISSYSKDFKLIDEHITNQVSLRDFLSHRTGLPSHDLSFYLFHEKESDKLLEKLANLPFSSALREKYQYNNYGYLLAADLVEEITNDSWNNLIETKLLHPLKMKLTLTNLPEKAMNLSHGFSIVNDESKFMPYYKLEGMQAAGSIVSNGLDMAKWIRCWINFGKFDNKQIIPVSYVQEAISSQMIMRPELPDNEFPNLFFKNYGFAWMLSSYKGLYRVEHGGNINGFSANMCFFPTEQLGIIVLTNQNNSSAPYIIRNTLVDHFLSLPKDDWLTDYLNRKSLNNSDETSNSTELTPLKKSSLSGDFNHPGYGTIHISNVDGFTYATAGLFSFGVFQKNKNSYVLKAQPNQAIDADTLPDINFDVNDDGTVIAVELESRVPPLLFNLVKD
ncbi:serine hydrolase domain-containing protein [uncultured Croceitalea sp.]|uniref:serine hydrolase domain-containing protein n=1 Tax=uncultured Croceitalea sp. TaxID=1798908 RepID=UPI003306179C